MNIMKRIAMILTTLAVCAGAFADANIDLYNAVKLNRLGDVQSALRMGANPNQRIAAGGGKSSFALAVENDNKMIIETMLKDSTRIPVAINGDNTSEPPLFYAIRNKSQAAVEILIKYGANANVNYEGDCPLFFILRQDQSHIMLKTFIDACERYHANIDYNAVDKYDNNALHYAVTGGDFNRYTNENPQSLNLLLKSGKVRKEAQNSDGNTILHLAFKGHNVTSCKYILADTDLASILINKSNNNGITPAGAFVEMVQETGSIDEELFLNLISIAGMTNTSIWNGGKDAKSKGIDNGLITLVKTDDVVATGVFKNRQCKIQKYLAELEDNEGNPLLCLAIQEKWSPELVDLMIDKTNARDWKKIKMKSGRYKNMNAIEIMRKNHTEDEYEDIFNDYM